MQSPGGWQEPGQRPDFDEFTVVLRGMLQVEYEGGSLEVRAGQAVIVNQGEWVRYSTPEGEGAEYLWLKAPQQCYSNESELVLPLRQDDSLPHLPFKRARSSIGRASDS